MFSSREKLRFYNKRDSSMRFLSTMLLPLSPNTAKKGRCSDPEKNEDFIIKGTVE